MFPYLSPFSCWLPQQVDQEVTEQVFVIFFFLVIMNIFIVGYSGFHSGRKSKTRHCFSLKNTSKESTSDALHSENPVNFKSCFYKSKI